MNKSFMRKSTALNFGALLVLGFLSAFVCETKAQQVAPMALQECIRLAQNSSPEARIAQKAYASVYWSYKSYKAGLLPQMRLDLNTPGILRSISQITQPDGTQAFIEQNQAFSSGVLSISQQIAPTGGTISLSSGLTRLDVFGNNAYRIYQGTPLRVGLNQPLFNYNELRWQRQIQPIQFQVAEKRYLEALEDIAVSTAGKYFDVYIAEMTLKNAEFNLRITDSVYTISEGRYRVGKIAENDLLQTELAYLNAQAQLQSAEIGLQKSKLELAISLGLNSHEQISVLSPEELPIMPIDQEVALMEARSNRSDLLDFQVRGLEAESALAQAKANSRFNANINATFGLNQSGALVADAYRNLLDQQTASIGIGIPILQWGRGKARIESAEVARDRVNEQIKLDQRRLERDVRFQVMDFLQVQKQLIIAAKADTIGQRRFDVAKNRYLIGKIDITNLQIAQSEKDNARTNYIQALKRYWVTYFQLRRATLFDFVRKEKLVVPESDF